MRERPWKERKRAYIESLATASPGALLVSAADKLHNARATLRDLREHGAIVWTRFSPTREQTLANYRNLIAAYETATPDPRRAPILRELRETVELLQGDERGHYHDMPDEQRPSRIR